MLILKIFIKSFWKQPGRQG